MSSPFPLASFRFPGPEVVYEAVDLANGKSSEKRIHSIPRKPVSSTSLYLTDSKDSANMLQKHVQPELSARTLSKDYFELATSVLILILPVPFFILVFYSTHLEGREIEYYQWSNLQSYMKASVTAFPIIFAAIAGRAVKKFASWRLEDGARIGTLEQLMGSTSLGGTLASILSLRLCNTLTPILLLMWALSPLGGQSSLHLVSIGTRSAFAKVNITYYDTRSQSAFAQGVSAYDVYLGTMNAVFQTSIMEPPSAQISTRDLWGNVRIPNLASLTTPESLLSPLWTNITSSQNLTYSSLLGIPVSGLPQNGQTTMALEASYITLTQVDGLGNISNSGGPQHNTINATLSDSIANGTWHWKLPTGSHGGLLMAIDGFNLADGNFSLGYDVYNSYSSHGEFATQTPRYLMLYSVDFRYVRTYALSITYVETKISCNGLPVECQPIAIRASQQPHINQNITNLAYSDTWSSFALQMASAVALDQSAMPTIAEAYMNDPSTVAAASVLFAQTFNNLTATDAQLQTRAQQLLNTYWQASVNPAVAIVGLNATGDELQTVRTRNVEAVHETTTEIYKMNWAWWVVFTCATSIMLGLAVLTLMIEVWLRGPELLGYCTTLLRDSPFAASGRGVGSAMGPSERARRFKDVKVKLTDVQAGQDVGYIAIVEMPRTEDAGRRDWRTNKSWREKLETGRRLYA